MTKDEFIACCLLFSDALFRVAYYILEDTQDAEDAVQDLFLKLWSSGETFNVDNPRAYCMTMMKNLCIDRIRRERAVHPEPLEDRYPCDDDIVRSLESRETLDRIGKNMESLSSTQRKVISMRALEGLSYDEMSQRTGMSKLSLRVLLSQGRRKLKKML